MAKNPNRIPCSYADVKRAEKRGREQGCELTACILLFLLMNDFDFSHEDMARLNDRAELYLGQVAAGSLTLEEIKSALKEEYDLEIAFVRRTEDGETH